MKNITILLSSRLDESFAIIFRQIGCNVLWVKDESKLEKLIKDNDFDIAFEWQYGHQDHSILDLVKKYKKNVAVILCLNWHGKLPSDYLNVGYFDYINVPFKHDELNSIFNKVKERRDL